MTKHPRLEGLVYPSTNECIDPELTTIARRHEDADLWQPAVYRKTI